MEVFPDFNSATSLNEDEMKSAVGKEKWRLFMTKYEKKVRHYLSVGLDIIDGVDGGMSKLSG